MEYYLAPRGKGILVHTIACIDLKDMPKQLSQPQKDECCMNTCIRSASLVKNQTQEAEW